MERLCQQLSFKRSGKYCRRLFFVKYFCGWAQTGKSYYLVESGRHKSVYMKTAIVWIHVSLPLRSTKIMCQESG